MPNDVRIGITGSIASAPIGTALPTTATEPLAGISADYVDVGYVSDEGVTPNFEDSSTKIRKWGGEVVRVVTNESSINFGFTLIQTARPMFERFLAGAVFDEPSPGNYRIRYSDTKPDPRVWVITAVDGAMLWRWALPSAQLYERGEVAHVQSEVLGWPMMIEALPDAANGERLHILTTEPAWYGYS